MKETRVRVDVKWDEESKSFHAFDEKTGDKILTYRDLTYGDNDDAKNNVRNDAHESGKTLDGNRRNKTDAVAKAYVTVPVEEVDSGEAGTSDSASDES